MKIANVAMSIAFAASFLPAVAGAQSAAASGDRKLSYALGYEAGRDLGQHGLQIDISAVLRGVQDGFGQKKPAFSPQEMQAVIAAMQQGMVSDARAAFVKLAGANLQKSRQFFAANSKKTGVITLPSGVQYKVLDRGDGGKNPTVDSVVTLQYRGSFLDGTIFVSTDDRGTPEELPVNRMFRGWQQVITLMHVGDHWQVFIPPQMAYGSLGEPPLIGPNQALVFDIHLLGIKP